MVLHKELLFQFQLEEQVEQEEQEGLLQLIMGHLKSIKLMEQKKESLTYFKILDIQVVQHLMIQCSSLEIDNPNFKRLHLKKPVKNLRINIHLHLLSRIRNTRDYMKLMAKSFPIILAQNNLINLKAVISRSRAELDFRNIEDIHITIRLEAKNTVLEVYYIPEWENITKLAMYCNPGLE